MGDAVHTAIKAVTPASGEPIMSDAQQKAIWVAACTAIVAHIQANAQVLPTALISGAPGAPVTGTGTVT